MSQNNSVSKKSGTPRFLIFVCTAIAVLAALPFVFNLATTAHADGSPVGFAPTLVANLTGEPIGTSTPRGFSAYYVAPMGTPPARQLHVSVSNVNLPAGTQLAVSLNSASIGSITLDSMRRGFLFLSTANGGTVPEVVSGDTLTIAGDATILSGTFAAPPTPSPTSTHTPWPTPSHTPWPSPSGTPLPPRAFAARMSGANEVPPVTTTGMGIGFVGINSAGTQIRVCVGFRNLSSAVTAITINGPASTTENGPVIFTLTLPTTSFGYASGTFDVTADQIAELRARLWYFQVSTETNPTGEIRGQLNPITPRSGGGHHTGGGGGGIVATQSNDDTASEARSVFNVNADTDNDSYVAAPFDFDEDGITDIATFTSGTWQVTRSSDGKAMAYQPE